MLRFWCKFVFPPELVWYVHEKKPVLCLVRSLLSLLLRTFYWLFTKLFVASPSYPRLATFHLLRIFIGAPRHFWSHSFQEMVHEGGKSERGNFKATQAAFESPLVLRIMTGGQAGSLQLCCGIVPPLWHLRASIQSRRKPGEGEKGIGGKGELSGWTLFNWNPRLNYFT